MVLSMQREEPVLLFEIAPTPPLSPFSEANDVACVPQLPGTAAPSTIIGGGGDADDAAAPVDWSNLYALMSELPEFACGGGEVLDAATSDSTAASSRCGSPWAPGELPDAFAPAPAPGRGHAAGRSPSPASASPPTSPALVPAAAGTRRPSARLKARGAARQPVAGKPVAGKPVAGKPRRARRDPAGLGTAVTAITAITAARSRLAGSELLPAGHKPARGRGRQLQLATMSEEQKNAEAKARLEKNRQAAREFRMRRKEHVVELENKVAGYEHRDRRQQAEIAKLKGQVARLMQQVAAMRR